MKRLLIILVSLLCSLNVYAQVRFYTFNSLDGLEDKEGNTHLFYRKYYLYNAGANHSEENSIYRYDVNKNKDTLIASDYSEDNPVVVSGKIVSAISFFDNDPYKYIFCGGRYEHDGYIFKAESGYTFGAMFMSVDRIEVSKQNPLRVFATAMGEMALSSDGGITWPQYDWINGFTPSKNFFLLSAFPNDDKIMLGLKDNHLVKSLDTGTTFVEVDTSGWNYSSRFYYDLDTTHIYGSANGDNGYSFVAVSDKNGDAFSWKKIWESPRKIFISMDQSLVGHSLYLADGKNIFLSHDYGKTFSHYRKLDRSIVGIYKKPGSNILYAATKYNLYEITSNETKIIKLLPLSPETLSYYPLAVGNKWNFNIFRREYLSIGYKDENGIMTREVIGDTLLPNGYKYFVLEQKEKFEGLLGVVQLFIERLDSTTGKIYRYNLDKQEKEIDDLTADIGDTLELYRYPNSNTPQVIYQGEELKNFDNQMFKQKDYFLPNSLFYTNYSLIEGIGLNFLSADFDLGFVNWLLKGCVISGKVIGDTSLVVGIKDENNDIPSEFSLSQNYPNPFNPETVISYQLPVNSKVSLKVYAVLGNEIATLVNEEKPAGTYQVNFNMERNTNNRKLTSGVYFYQLRAGQFVQTKKFVLIK